MVANSILMPTAHHNLKVCRVYFKCNDILTPPHGTIGAPSSMPGINVDNLENSLYNWLFCVMPSVLSSSLTQNPSNSKRLRSPFRLRGECGNSCCSGRQCLLLCYLHSNIRVEVTEKQTASVRILNIVVSLSLPSQTCYRRPIKAITLTWIAPVCYAPD